MSHSEIPLAAFVQRLGFKACVIEEESIGGIGLCALGARKLPKLKKALYEGSLLKCCDTFCVQYVRRVPTVEAFWQGHEKPDEMLLA